MSAQFIERALNDKNAKAQPLLVVKIIIEMLANVINPSAIAKNLESTELFVFPSVAIEELPNVDYERNARGLKNMIQKKLAAYALVKNSGRLRTFWGGASRRTVALTSFEGAMFNDDVETMRAIFLDSSKVLLGKTSEETI